MCARARVCVCACTSVEALLKERHYGSKENIITFVPPSRDVSPTVFREKERERERERENSRNAGVNQSSVFLLDLSAPGKEKVRFIDISL